MNGVRAKWLKDRIGFDDTPSARRRYKLVKKWWKSLSHKERKPFAHCGELAPGP